MSTPSGKPFDRVRISDYAPKTVRDRLASSGERKSSDPPDGLVTPLRAIGETPFDRPRRETGEEGAPMPLAPVGPHEHSRAAPDRSGEEHFFEEDEGYSTDETSSEVEAGSEEHADRPVNAEPDQHTGFTDHSREYEADLQRLESDLEALRGVAGEDTGRRAASGEAPAVRELRRARETYIDGIRLPRSLEPSYLPPPPMRDRPNHLGAVSRILIACALAAPLTYFLISYFSTMSDTTAKRGTKVASVETQVAALPPMPEPQTREAPSPPPKAALLPAPPAAPPPRASAPAPHSAPAPVAQSAPAPAAQPPVAQQPETQPAASFTLQSSNPSWPAQREAPRETSGVAAAPSNPPQAPARVAVAPMPAPAATAPAPARRPAVKMDSDEIAILLKQGEQFISTGDVVTARVLFERAAEGGNASGALALGATYDPAVLAKLGVRGIAPDVAKARQWYERARDLGSAEARGRLETLAQR